MATHTFIVEVEVERDQGLFAPRDEISERLEEALGDLEGVDLTGMGAQSSSDYSIINVSIDAVDVNTKAGRDALMAYDNQVIAELPGDAELRKRNKQLSQELKELNKVLDDVKDRNIKYQETLAEQQAVARTRIWYADPSERRQEYKHFIPDGKYDRIYFQYGERDDQNVAIELYEDGSMEIRNQGWTQMVVLPQSANTIILKTEAR